MLSRRINSTTMERLMTLGIAIPSSIEEEDLIYELNEEAKKSAKESKCTKIKRTALVVYPGLEEAHNPFGIVSSGINKPVNGINGYCNRCPIGKTNGRGGIVKNCKLSVLAEEDAITNFWTAMVRDKNAKQILRGDKVIYNFKYEYHPKLQDELGLTSAYSFPDYSRMENMIRLNIKKGVYRLFSIWYTVDFKKLIEHSAKP